MCEMKSFVCLGNDGVERTFYFNYAFDSLNKSHCFEVHDSLQGNKEPFEFAYKAKDSEGRVWQQTSMFHHYKPEFSAMGIPYALLPLIRDLYNVTIVSSPKKGVSEVGEEDIRRQPDATKFWERMCERGLAEYNAVNDTYTLLGSK